MSTNKTENLNLHSWVRTDLFNMDEFNENFTKLDETVGELDGTVGELNQGLTDVNQGLAGANSKIDQGLANVNTALAAKAANTALQTLDARVTSIQGTIPRVAGGTYNGTESASAPTTITLGFKPKAVLINMLDTAFTGGYCGLIVENVPLKDNATKTTTVGQITANGFVTYYVNGSPALNHKRTYCYLAVG